jgi:hypothetical protein
MKPTNRKEISEALKEAMNKEDLHTRDAAKYLNINPCYISMAQNPNSWDSMGKASWIRLEEWFNTNSRITLFEIPSGEEIWVPREKPVKTDGSDMAKRTEIKIPKFAEKQTKQSNKTDKPPKFNYDFLKGKDLLDTKEKEAELMDFIGLIIEKRLKEFQTTATLEATIDPTHVKVALDIEINLVLNGQKVRLN